MRTGKGSIHFQLVLLTGALVVHGCSSGLAGADPVHHTPVIYLYFESLKEKFRPLSPSDRPAMSVVEVAGATGQAAG